MWFRGPVVFLGSSVAASAVCSGSFWNLQPLIRGIPLFLGGLDLGAKDKPGRQAEGARGERGLVETPLLLLGSLQVRVRRRMGGIEPEVALFPSCAGPRPSPASGLLTPLGSSPLSFETSSLKLSVRDQRLTSRI